MNIHVIRMTVLIILCGIITGQITQAESSVKKGDGLYAMLETNRGDIHITFTYKRTPLTVCNFIGLAEGTIDNEPFGLGVPYFDGLTWHRVVEDWVIQSGCPNGDGRGGPGYVFPCEIDTPALMHDRPGTVGMANTGPNTVSNGSQFYITHGGGEVYDRLNGGYTIFGYVEDSASLDVVMAIRQDDLINRVTIQRVGDDALAFKTDQHAFDSLLNDLTDIQQSVTKSDKVSPLQIQYRQGTFTCRLAKPGFVALAIYALNGRELFSMTRQVCTTGVCTIPHKCRPGIYVVRIQGGNTVITRKVAVQKYR